MKEIQVDMRVRKINDSYQNMLGNILRLMANPETTPDQLQQAREALINAKTTCVDQVSVVLLPQQKLILHTAIDPQQYPHCPTGTPSGLHC